MRSIRDTAVRCVEALTDRVVKTNAEGQGRADRQRVKVVLLSAARAQYAVGVQHQVGDGLYLQHDVT